MGYRYLGRSGLRVSTPTKGARTSGRAKTGPLGNVDGKDATRQLDRCIAAGVNLFDTADVLARGASQETLGSTWQ